MFEGKHIHFSPVDNKPLCSFSNKLCRQRRLNGFAFCIRHILEDKSAPFKRCTYMTRNNNQICQNAIPTSQERGYCHSHMQVAGIIPKTERKVKNPLALVKGDSASNVVANGKPNIIFTNTGVHNQGTNVKKDPNAVFKFEEEHSEIQWIPKGGSINGIVNGSKNCTLKVKNSSPNLKKDPSKNAAENGEKISKKHEGKNGKINQDQNGFTTSEKAETSRQTYGKKSFGKNSKNFLNTTLTNPCNSDKQKLVNDSTTKNIESPIKLAIPTATCVPEHETYFEQLKTLKAIDESVCKTETSSKLAAHSGKTVPILVDKPAPSGLHRNLATVVAPNDVRSTTSSEFRPTSKTQTWIYSRFWKTAGVTKTDFETRQEFLARVRQTLKSQYLSIKSVTKESEKNEKIWKRALRNSLLTCVVKDSSYCAHFLVQHNNSKVSPSENQPALKTCIQYPEREAHGTNAAKAKKLVKLTGQSNNGISEFKGNQNFDKKFVKLNGLTKLETNAPKNMNVCSLSDRDNGSKASKPTYNAENQGKISELIKEESRSIIATNKRKPRKVGSCQINGRSGNGTDTVSKKVYLKAAQKNGNDSISTKELLNAIISGNGSNKKRKFDVSSSNGINDSGMDGRAIFRVPKLDDSSNLSGADEKSESSNLLNNNFNAHLTHPLFHHGSSSNTSNLASAHHLQQILNQPDLRSLTSHRNQGLDTVLNSVGSTDMGTSDGVITDASFDSTFDHSASSQQDCEFSDDDLEKSLEFQLDPETEHQASRLLEDNEITEDDLNELFPETRVGDNKLGRSDLDLGIDFTSTFDADIDYSLFANIFPFTRPNQSESISVTNQF